MLILNCHVLQKFMLEVKCLPKMKWGNLIILYLATVSTDTPSTDLLLHIIALKGYFVLTILLNMLARNLGSSGNTI
jgi:hypothetical protein